MFMGSIKADLNFIIRVSLIPNLEMGEYYLDDLGLPDLLMLLIPSRVPEAGVGTTVGVKKAA
jgi:hypothetical protein